MRKFVIAITAAAMALPVVATAPADAARRTHYYSHTCHRHHGTTGAIVGGAGGALVGRAVGGHGLAGPLVGGVGGALLGRHIARHNSRYRC